MESILQNFILPNFTQERNDTGLAALRQLLPRIAHHPNFRRSPPTAVFRLRPAGARSGQGDLELPVPRIQTVKKGTRLKKFVEMPIKMFLGVTDPKWKAFV
jgi:hypothetical protein